MKRKHAIKRRDVDAFLDKGDVHESLAPILQLRAKQATAIVADLGGAEAVSTVQVCAIDGWLRAQTCADALLTLFLQNPTPSKACEKFATLQSLALKHLSVIGVKPLRAAEAESLQTIVAEIDEAKS